MEALKTTTEQLHYKPFGACWSNTNCFFTFKGWHMMKPKIYIVVMGLALASKWQEWCFHPPLNSCRQHSQKWYRGIQRYKVFLGGEYNELLKHGEFGGQSEDSDRTPTTTHV
jgi:hypothetical protein